MKKGKSWLDWRTHNFKREMLHRMLHQVCCYTLVVFLAASQMIYVHGEEAITKPETSQTREQKEMKKIVSFKNFQADGMKPYQEIEAEKGTSEEALGLPKTLSVVLQDASEEDIAITWKCINDSFSHAAYDSNNLNAVFTFEAVLPKGYEIENEDVAIPWLRVQLKERETPQKAATNTIESRATSTEQTVTSLSELKAAINDTTTSTIIVNGTIELTEGLTIKKNLTLKGADANAKLIRSASYTGDLIVLQGKSDSVYTSYYVTFQDLIIDGNDIEVNKSCIVVKDVSLTLNSGVIIQNNRMVNNSSPQISSIVVGGDSTKDTSTLKMNSNSKIINNTKSDNSKNKMGGAAILIKPNSKATIGGGEISNNTSTDGANGGAIYNMVGLLEIQDGLFSSNVARNDKAEKVSAGGFLYNVGRYVITSYSGDYTSASTTIKGGKFLNNSSDIGGVIASKGSQSANKRALLYITGGYFSGNAATATTSETYSENMADVNIGGGGVLYVADNYTYTEISGGILDRTNKVNVDSTRGKGTAIFYANTLMSKYETDKESQFMIKGTPSIHGSIYVMNNYGSYTYNSPYITLSNKLSSAITIEPTKYDLENPLVKGTSSYTITESDLQRINIVPNSKTPYYPVYKGDANNEIILSKTKPSYITDKKDPVYVDGVNGSDETGDGSIDHPYQTIDKGVENTTTNGQVIIKDTVTINKGDNEYIDSEHKVTITPSKECKVGDDKCKDGMIVVENGGSLNLGDITIDPDLNFEVKPGGNIEISGNVNGITYGMITQPEDKTALAKKTTVYLNAEVLKQAGYTYRYQWYKNSVNSTSGGTPIDTEKARTNQYEFHPQDVETSYYYCVITASKSGTLDTVYTSNAAKINIIEDTLDNVEAVAETVKGKNDGKLIHVNDYMKYRKKGDTEFTPVPKGKETITGLEPGEYTLRYNFREDISKKVTIAEGGLAEPEITIQDSNHKTTYTYGSEHKATLQIKNVTEETLHITKVDCNQENNPDIFNVPAFTNQDLAPNETYTLEYTIDKHQSVGDYQAAFTISYCYGSDATEKELTKDLLVKIEAKEIMASLKTDTSLTKVYDGTTNCALGEKWIQITGIEEQDLSDVALTITSAAYDEVNAGKRIVTINLEINKTSEKAKNYKLKESVLTAETEITRKPVDIQLNTEKAIEKTYDKSTILSLNATYFTVNGAVQGESLTTTATATFDSANAGKNRNVKIHNFVLSDSNNYEINTKEITSTGTIYTRQLMVNAKNPIIKEYDGDRSATATQNENYTIEGTIFTGDTVSLRNANLSFNDENVGKDKTVTLNNFTSSNSNYEFTNSEITIKNCEITPRKLNVSLKNDKPITKTYDGTTSITVSVEDLQLDRLLKFDTKNVKLVVGEASFDNAAIGKNKVVTLKKLSLEGSNATNYVLEKNEVHVDGTILGSPLTITLNQKAVEKVYDGTTKMTLTNEYFNISGLLTGAKDVQVKGTVIFHDKNVGVGKTLTVNNFEITGTNSDLYSVNTLELHGVGSIKVKEISISKGISFTKEYDATRNAKPTGAYYLLKDVVASDDVSITYESAAFNNENVADANAITISGIKLYGNDKDNYVLKQDSLTIDASITPKRVEVVWEFDKFIYNHSDQSDHIHASYIDVENNKIPLSFVFEHDAKFINAGQYKANIEDNNANYSFINTEKEFVIEQKPLTEAMIEGPKACYIYTGSAITPTIKVIDGSTLIKDIDYTIAYENNVNIGTGYVNVTGTGNYTGTISKPFAIGYEQYIGSVLPEEGRNDAGYYHEDITITLPNGYQISLDDKTYTDTMILDKEVVEEELRYFIKDTLGNKYSGAETYSLDKTSPILSGVNQDHVYYVDQVLHIEEANLKSIVVNGHTVDYTKDVKIEGNKEQLYTIVVTDMADNTAEITFEVKPIEHILPNLTMENVTAGDKTTIENAIAQLNALDTKHASVKQKTEITKDLEQLQALLQKIDSIQEQIKQAQTGFDKVKTPPHHTGYKDILEALQKEVTALLDSKNLSEKQREECTELLNQINGVLQHVIDLVNAFHDAESTLNSYTKEDVQIHDKDEIIDAMDALHELIKNNNLSQSDQESANELLAKGQELLDQIEEDQKQIDNTIDDITKELDDMIQTPLYVGDKDLLEDLKNKLEDMIAGGNITEKQEAEIKDLIDKAEEAIHEINRILEAFHQAKKEIDRVTIETIQHADSDRITHAKDTLQGLLDKGNLTESQQNEALAYIEKANQLLSHLDKLVDKIKDVHDRYDEVVKDPLHSDDKDELVSIKNDIEQLLNGNNLSDDQRNDLKDLYDEVKEAIHQVEAIEKAYDDAKKVIVDNTVDDVKTDDKQSIQDAIDTLNKLKDQEHVNEEQKKEVEELIQKGQDLLDKIKEVEDKLSHIDDVKDLTSDTITKDDSHKVDEVLDRIENLENNHMGNLNDQQKEEVEKQKEHAQELEKIIDEIKKVEDMIHALPKPVTNEEEYHQALEAKDAYDKLSPNQKEQIDDAILDSLENILNHYGNAILYDDPTGIMVEGIEYYFLPHIRLHVDVVTKNTPAAIHAAIQNQMTNHEILSEVYDITLMANNETIQPKGKVNVYIPLTKEQRAYKALRLVSINAQGEVVEIESRREGDFLVFTTDHFSYYAIIGEAMANGNQENGDVTTADHTDMHMYILMMLVSLGFLIGMKKKYRKQ